MQLQHLLIAAGVAACHGCNPLKQWWSPTKIRSWFPDALPTHTSSEIVFRLESGAPKTAGLSLWAADGRQAASIDCELTHESSVFAIGDLPEVTCPTPPLAPGSYSMRFSSDSSCGSKSYAPLNVTIDVVEPAHLTAVSPAHGPEKIESSVTLTGSNIGGPHVVCSFTFPAAPGAKMGCSMDMSGYPASEVTSTSVVCRLPKWPGPVMKYDGHGGFNPSEGAVCSREVQVQLTNDGRVYSQESVVFRYDDSAEVLV